MTTEPRTPRWGGYTAIANELSTPERPVSRQLVYAWCARRDHNGFPAPVTVQLTGTRRDKTARVTRQRWDLDEVVAWYATYVPDVGGRPRKGQASDH